MNDLFNYNGNVEFLKEIKNILWIIRFKQNDLISKKINNLSEKDILNSKYNVSKFASQMVIEHLDMVNKFVNNDKTLQLFMPIYEHIKEIELDNSSQKKEIEKLKEICEVQNKRIEEYQTEFGLSTKDKKSIELEKMRKIEEDEWARFAYEDLCEHGAFSDEGIMPNEW